MVDTAKPAFDPSQPFDAVKPAFDPNQPYSTGDENPGVLGRVMNEVKSIPHGMVQGFSDAASAAGKGAALEQSDPELASQIPSGKEGADIVQKEVTGQLPQGGKYGERVGEMLGNPASYIGPGGLPAKVLTAATAGLGSQAGEDITGSPWGGVAGAVLGGGLPGTVSKAITPFPISAQRAGAVKTLTDAGVQPTAGQITGNKALRYAESTLGDAPGAGGAATKATERTNEQFTNATLGPSGASRSPGQTTPEVIDERFNDIGNALDTLAARNVGIPNQQYFDEIQTAKNEYDHLFHDPNRKPIVENIVNQAWNQAHGGQNLGIMDGTQYAAARSNLGRIQRSYRYSDPEVADFASDVQGAMDRMMQRNMKPGDAQAWQQARTQYRNLLTLSKASTGAGENAAAGNISPAKIRSAAVAQDQRGFSRGQGDYTDLARAGEQILTPLPNSGTAQRGLAIAIPATITSALMHNGISNPEELLGALGLAAAPGITGRGLMSAPVQAYMGNQAAPQLSKVFKGGAARGGIADVLSKLAGQQ